MIGDCIIDEILDPGGAQRWPGGAGLNLAVGLRTLGVPTTLIAQVGTDQDGARLREYVERNDVRLVAKSAPEGTGVATSDRTEGEPSYSFNAALAGRGLSFDDDDLELVSTADAVVVTSINLDDQSQVDGLLSLWHAAPALRAIDPNPRPAMLRSARDFRAGFEQIATLCGLVKISDEDAALLYPELHGGVDALGELVLDLGCAAVLLTRGAAGASVRTTSGIRVDAEIAKVPGPIIDTMGAGDATLATVLSELVRADHLSGAEWKVLLDRAMRVAATTCRQHGGALILPTC